MADDDSSASSFRLMNFVSQEQLAEARRTRGARVEDGTAQRDRPLYEILKDNKDKKDAEFNERFKHRPPKALDEDETEFLDKLEMSRRKFEQQMADEEAQQMRSFQAAVVAQSTIVHELKEAPPVTRVQDEKLVGKKNPPSRPTGMIIKVKPQAKKPKVDPANSGESLDLVKAHNVATENSVDSVKATNDDGVESNIPTTGLVSYSDESEED